MNPFLSDYNKVTLDDDGNIINGVLRDAVIGEYKFIKIFTSNTKWLTELGKSDMILLEYIISNIESGIDVVEIKYNDVNISSSSFYESIKKLEDIRLIKKKDKNIYWINPYRIFSGSRETYIKDKFKVDDKEWQRFKKIRK